MNNEYGGERGVFFDLDNTLYSYEPCNEYAKKKLFSFLAKQLQKSAGAVQNAFEEGRKVTNTTLRGLGASHSRLLYIQKTIEAIAGRTDASLSVEAHDFFWQAFFSRMRLRPGALSFLKELQSRGVRSVIITNLTADIQLQKVAVLKLERHIDYVVASEEAGREKPAPEVFQLALRKTGLRKREVVVIGDDYENDIVGARRLGIRGIYFQTDNSPIADKKLTAVKSFKELSQLFF